jgi:thiamine biosynthesis lipoprotein
MARSGISHIKLILLLLLFMQSASAGWLREEADIMGTRITVELFHAHPDLARHAIDGVLSEMRRIDAGMSPYIKTSELARLNESAQQQAFATSDELFSLIQRSLDFSELTDGAFDITFASVGFLYDYRNRTRPDDGQREKAAALINYRKLVFDHDSSTIAFSNPGMRIDLGGIAKGHAVDRCIGLLQQLGVKQALVTAGGDSRMIGNRWGRPWSIGVRDPRNEDKLAAVIPLQDVAVSTSGDYQRYFEEDGIRYHHIINPRSGDSARALQSVTIIGPDATTTDALSTSVFVMGLESGLELINRMSDIDAILVDQKGRLHYSDNLLAAKKTDGSIKPSAASLTY